MSTEIAAIAQHAIDYGTNYPGEVYTANSNTNPSSVQIKTFYYGSTYTPATLWKTCAQVDTDGCGQSYGSSSHQSRTTLSSSVNSDTIPYIVLPSNNNNNVAIGDIGIVVDVSTGSFVYVIYADRGPSGKIGEASVAVHKALGYTYYANGKLCGHDSLDIVYIMFPGTGKKFGYGIDKPVPTAAQIASNAAPYFSAMLGYITQI